MNFQQFSEELTTQLTPMFPDGTQISIQTIPKNNGVFLDAIIIREPGINVSPTIYLEDYYGIPYDSSDATLSGEEFLSLLKKIKGEELSDALGGATTITRRQAARLIDEHLDPFSIKVNWSGKLQATR